MIEFGCGMSSVSSARSAAREAAQQALASLGVPPKLVLVFASVSYDDFDEIPAAVRAVSGSAIILGGSSGGCVLGPERCDSRGVSVVMLGGTGIEVEARVAPFESADLLEIVPSLNSIAAAADAASARGFAHYACLVFAPGIVVDGEALVAAVRKGAGARAQLAGAITGDDLTLDRPRVLANDEVYRDAVVVAGLFTKRPLGIAARHGWREVGPVRRVTRTDGMFLLELDGRPAADVWIEDARAAGADVPADREQIALYLANHYVLGIAAESSGTWRTRDPRADATPTPSHVDDGERELVARAPFVIRDDGGVKLSATIAEGARVRVLHASREELLRASGEAARSAVERAGKRVSGALLLSCSGRLAALGSAFPEEVEQIRRVVKAPVAGTCVFGEIARNVRDADAFFNSTVVVAAFPESS